MDDIKVPYKVGVQVKTFKGEWTAEQIDAGEVESIETTNEEIWFENTKDGPQPIYDQERIRQLEESIK